MADNVKPYNLNDSWDGKYTNGDDLWYAASMLKSRVLSKPTSNVREGLAGGLKWTAYSSTSSKLQAWPDDTSITLTDATGGTSLSDENRVISINPEFAGTWLDITVNSSTGLPDSINFDPASLSFGVVNFDPADGYLNLVGNSYVGNVDTPDNVIGGTGAYWNVEIPLANPTNPGVIRTGYQTSGLNRALQIDSATGKGFITLIDTKMSNKSYTTGTDTNVVVGTRITSNTTLADVTKTLTAGTWTNIVGATSAITFNWAPKDVMFSSGNYLLGDGPLSLFGISYNGSTQDNVIGSNTGAAWQIDIPLASYTPASGSVEESYQPGVINLGHPGGTTTLNNLTYLNFPVLTDTNGRAYTSVNEGLFGSINAIINYGDTHQAELAGEGIINTDGTIDISLNSTAILGRTFIEAKVSPNMFTKPLVATADSNGKTTVGLQLGGNISGTYVQSGLTVHDNVSGYLDGLSVALNSESSLIFDEHGYIKINIDNKALSLIPNSVTKNGVLLSLNPGYFDSNCFLFTLNTNSNGIVSENLGVRIATTGSGENQALGIATGNSAVNVLNTAQGLYVKNASSSQAGVVKLYNEQTLGSSATVSTSGTNYYGLQLDLTSKKVFVAVPSADVTNGNVGVTKLYNSVMGDSDTHTDGAPTLNAVHSAYIDLLGRITGATFHFVIYPSIDQLPQAGSTYGTTIALVPLTHSPQGGSYYEEYVCIDKGTAQSPNWVWEKLGDTDFELENLGSTNVSAIISDVFGF